MQLNLEQEEYRRGGALGLNTKREETRRDKTEQDLLQGSSTEKTRKTKSWCPSQTASTFHSAFSTSLLISSELCSLARSFPDSNANNYRKNINWALCACYLVLYYYYLSGRRRRRRHYVIIIRGLKFLFSFVLSTYPFWAVWWWESCAVWGHLRALDGPILSGYHHHHLKMKMKMKTKIEMDNCLVEPMTLVKRRLKYWWRLSSTTRHHHCHHRTTTSSSNQLHHLHNCQVGIVKRKRIVHCHCLLLLLLLRWDEA